MFKKTLIFIGIALFVLAAAAPKGFAADGTCLDNQPQVSDEIARHLLDVSRTYTVKNGDVVKARQELISFAQNNATSDFVFKIQMGISDSLMAESLVGALEAAYAKADTKNKSFILYNIARIQELRAARMPPGEARKPFLDAARAVVNRFDITQDPGLWALRADIEADAGNTDAAISNYKRMGATGSGTPATAQYKIGWVLRKAERDDEAEAAFKSGVQAEAASKPNDGGRSRHYLYQALAELYLARSDYAQAAPVLLESVRNVKPLTTIYYVSPYALEPMLQQPQYAKTISRYATAVLVIDPSAQGMAVLRDKADATVRNQSPKPPASPGAKK